MLLVCDTMVSDGPSYFTDALADLALDGRDGVVHSLPGDGLPTLSDVDAVIVTGSTAGVYEADERPWIADGRRLVRELVAREIPTLGVCFGHQLVNDALGGTVDAGHQKRGIVEVELDDDPVFEGVSGKIPMVHGDYVVSPGDRMETIASADYYDHLATRHESAPVWTVQYHPEFTGTLLDRITDDFGWPDEEDHNDFDDVTAAKTVENFASLAGLD
ncbi:type 1 glutamine amidotransferase [Haloferax sp. MBLA0076]|uniref:Type 1 glutamine amidotransferase n=1 Tax=Haloferax litoreum TaxID=2666140 RepID=A0A6A8GGL5_9EURY|nr:MULTISPECIES: type 1 glutamine amidotransferase [Haloferax]KAB1192461.1 type 1 glutamine amidotransferase [Haloferax sp. CBA1148]MRX20930.1 type 1 glutamine amidotransferase [Haloferax litoreum]